MGDRNGDSWGGGMILINFLAVNDLMILKDCQTDVSEFGVRVAVD